MCKETRVNAGDRSVSGKVNHFTSSKYSLAMQPMCSNMGDYLVPQAAGELEGTTVPTQFHEEFVAGGHENTPHIEPTPTINNHDYIYTEHVPVYSVDDMLLAAQERIHELENKLCEHNTRPMHGQLHTRPDEITKFYTGFPSYQVLCATFQVIQPTAEKTFSWSQLQHSRTKGTEEVDQ